MGRWAFTGPAPAAGERATDAKAPPEWSRRASTSLELRSGVPISGKHAEVRITLLENCDVAMRLATALLHRFRHRHTASQASVAGRASVLRWMARWTPGCSRA